MDLNPDDWTLVLVDPATNYDLHDYAAALADPGQTAQQPILVLDAEHIETKIRMRLTIRVPVAYVRPLAMLFLAMADDIDATGGSR